MDRLVKLLDYMWVQVSVDELELAYISKGFENIVRRAILMIGSAGQGFWIMFGMKTYFRR